MNGSDLPEKKARIKSISDLDLYGMSKQALIKKIQVLVHQLKVYYQMEEVKDHLQYCNAKQFSQMMVSIESYKHNQEVLTQQLKTQEKKQKQLQSLLLQKQKQTAKLQKEVQIYKKKTQDFEKMGGKVKLQRLDELNRQQKQQLQSLLIDNSRLKKQVVEANNKCKILQELNSETELRVADIMANRQITYTKQCISPLKEQQNSIKRGNLLSNNESMVQILSLKEKVRQLREQLKAAEDSREHIRAKMQERQLFYSKLMASRI